MSDRLERLLSITLTIAAVLMVGLLGYRELFGSRSDLVASSRGGPPVYYEKWRELLPRGRQLGVATAPAQLIEFVDLECPACAHFEPVMRAVRHKYGNRIGVTFVHFPLSAIHRFALPAARAAECAADQGKFDAMTEIILRQRDSLGLKSWVAFAIEAGVADTVRFSACTRSTAAMSKVDEGLAAAEAAGVPGTQAVFLNGWRFRTVPSEKTLSDAIDALLQGKQPFASTN